MPAANTRTDRWSRRSWPESSKRGAWLPRAPTDTSEAWTRKYDDKMIGDIDASIVTDHMMLCAASLGLDTLWICMFKPEAVREEFALPPHVEPVSILLVGYGDGTPSDPDRHDTQRKPLDETVFHEHF